MNKAMLEICLKGEGWFPEGATLLSAPCGAVNLSFLLELPTQKYFVKTFLSDNFAPLDRQHLFALQKQLAEQEIAPNPYYLGKQQGFQIEQWIDGQSLAVLMMDEDKRLYLLAEALADIHQLTPDTKPLELRQHLQHYIHCCDTAVQPDMKAKLAQCEEALLANEQAPKTFCHNDLAFNHVQIFHHQRRVFDWEYAAYGDLHFDLASAIAVNQLSDAQQDIFLRAYADITKVDEAGLTERVKCQQPLLNLTSDFWYLAAKYSKT